MRSFNVNATDSLCPGASLSVLSHHPASLEGKYCVLHSLYPLLVRPCTMPYIVGYEEIPIDDDGDEEIA